MIVRLLLLLCCIPYLAHAVELTLINRSNESPVTIRSNESSVPFIVDVWSVCSTTPLGMTAPPVKDAVYLLPGADFSITLKPLNISDTRMSFINHIYTDNQYPVTISGMTFISIQEIYNSGQSRHYYECTTLPNPAQPAYILDCSAVFARAYKWPYAEWYYAPSTAALPNGYMIKSGIIFLSVAPTTTHLAAIGKVPGYTLSNSVSNRYMTGGSTTTGTITPDGTVIINLSGFDTLKIAEMRSTALYISFYSVDNIEQTITVPIKIYPTTTRKP